MWLGHLAPPILVALHPFATAAVKPPPMSTKKREAIFSPQVGRREDMRPEDTAADGTCRAGAEYVSPMRICRFGVDLLVRVPT